MPHLDRWERKAIGRARRFENSPSQYVTNQVYRGGRLLGNYVVKRFLNDTAPVAADLLKESPPVEINGKKFQEKTSAVQKIAYRIGAVATENAFEMAEDMSDAYFTRTYFYPEGADIAKELFTGQIPFDADLTREMFNTCGYELKADWIMTQLHEAAAQGGNTLTDESWRKRVTPHILRTTFERELNECLQFIREDHQKNPGLYNRQIMEYRMRLATEKLGEIFEKFSLDLANKTDYLEAPISLLPQKRPNYEDMELTKAELKLLSEVSRHSLFESKNDLEKRISTEVEKVPKLGLEETLAKFRNGLNKPVTIKGEEVPYRKGTIPEEDERRLIVGVLTLREVKQQYESRGFFNRLFSKAGRAERSAIQEMKAQLRAKLELEPEQMTTLLDLKTPLEQNVHIGKVLGVVLKQKPEMTFTESLNDLSKDIKEITTEIMEAFPDVETVVEVGTQLYQETKELVTETWNNLPDANTIINKATDVIEEVIEDMPDAETMIVNTANIISDTGAAIINALDFSEDLKFDFSFDEDDLPGSSPSQPSNPVKQEHKEQEAPNTQSATWGSFLWGSISSAASYFFGGQQSEPQPQQSEPQPQQPIKEQQPPVVNEPQVEDDFDEYWDGVPSDPVQYVKDQQQAVIKELNSNKDLDFVACRTGYAKLLYYKTLETTFAKDKLSLTEIDHAISDESVKKNTQRILKDPAFQKLNELTKKKGESIVQKVRAFLQKASEDPSVINELHKDYLQKVAAAKAPNEPQPQQVQPNQLQQVQSEPKPAQQGMGGPSLG